MISVLEFGELTATYMPTKNKSNIIFKKIKNKPKKSWMKEFKLCC